ncbi:MAG: hypothetical protein A2V88_10720 [Elusimicrobia bacterium RBG_16_66_12]|nr:MAG: hypothetical protein A2V88_10720 [Elusimicrobia bacterium RBG_16_66_12]
MRYWVYMNGEVPGSYEPEQLGALPGFTMTTLVCPAQGEIAEKNWRRAGEFDDIAKCVSSRAERSAPPPPPPAGPASSSAADVDSMLDTASNRLFSHVADLMKELENRREERALSVSLQRQISALKEDLAQTRERANMLEMRLPRIAELEEHHRKDHEALQSLQASLQSREQALNEARVASEKLKTEFEATKRRLVETQNDLAMRNRLVDKLSKELSDKELSLAKSLGLIRRMEEDLNRLCPEGLPGVSAPAVKLAEPAQPDGSAEETLVKLVAEPPRAKPNLPSAAFTTDEPPPVPPYLEPGMDRPKAHQALVNLIKKVFPGPPH